MLKQYCRLKVVGMKERKDVPLAGNHAPGAKAHDDYIAFVPGINPRPTLKPSFSAACKALINSRPFMARLKGVPFVER